MLQQTFQHPKVQMIRNFFVAARQRLVTGWAQLVRVWKNHTRRILWLVAVVVLVMAASILFVYLWKKWPAFRMLVVTLFAGLAWRTSQFSAWVADLASQAESGNGVTGENNGLFSNSALPPDREFILTAEDPTLLRSAEDGQGS